MTEEKISRTYELDVDDDSINADNLDFYKGEKGRTDRIGFTSDVVKMAFVHYVKGLGNIRCLSERDDNRKIIGKPCLCCQKYGEAKRRYGLVIVKYGTDSQGIIKKKNLADIDVEVKLWTIGDDKVGILKNIKREWETLVKNDITVTCTDTSYQKITTTVCKGVLWSSVPELREQVITPAKAAWDKVERFLGRRFTESELRLALGMDDGLQTSDESMADANVDLNDVLNQIEGGSNSGGEDVLNS